MYTRYSYTILHNIHDTPQSLIFFSGSPTLFFPDDCALRCPVVLPGSRCVCAIFRDL